MKTATLTEQSYHSSIVVNENAKEAYDKISRVNEWWAVNFEGRAQNLGDAFKVTFGETYVTFKITEAIPGKKVGWLVTDSYLPWQNDKTEWTGTEVVFEISEKNNATKIDMTHIGLTPEVECFENCQAGWNHYINRSLIKFINEGQGVLQKGQ
ncbi:MAG TPA: SRPBCC domain-containing protein [Mucilaginibacter sp.]|nr:SRPBCC domain-containing protein [Mucilaginibacter sp.]